ncbi:interferon-induced, double-stranded RNA-activated protein kinase isoform X2 [Hypomesus transpacificus]|uniref:interferon-induced, double-stranded RNA-activated protein kinase isoform X2 n=1 Tax=Hypomesus transpacificus TaxID=137520 RepID=UPI001F0768C8|nr:interferon-induced, double-stranded RNA-activated protein kinase isoform X2 [Hypomesus transpacificus]
MESKNYIAQLNEYTQRTRSELKYEDVGAEGPDHIKRFTVRAVVDKNIYPNGTGRNKKEAKQNAAKNALDGLDTESNDTNVSLRGSPSPLVQVINAANFTCWLNEYGQKNRISVKYSESARVAENNHMQCCCCVVVGDKECPTAFGNTKKEAKEEAAKLVYEMINNNHTTGTVEENSKANPSPQNKDWSQETRSTRFVYKVVMGSKEYPEGVGKTAKSAKQLAAELTWLALQEQPDWNSQVSSNVSEDEVSPSQSSRTGESCDTRESCDTTPQSMATSDTQSVVFAESTNTSQKKNHQDAKPKIKLAPNFQFANHPNNQPVSRFSTDFDSIERMGKGGFGHVYKARLKIDKRYYAVKIVRSKAKSIREVDALARLEHCNIVRYYTTWMEDIEYKCANTSDSGSTSHSGSDASAKFLYIQMELCGKTLKTWIDERNAERDLKRREMSQGIIQQILHGVEYIHSNKLIHRDLKPSNIMFAGNEKVKIGDFGLATTENDDDDESLIERTKRTGTRSYMAPEQINTSTYDRKVDIFALGLIFFELLWKLFTVAEKNKVWYDVRSNIFPKGFSVLYAPEQKLMESMLKEHPEDRPEAKQLVTELGSYVVPSKDQNSLKANQTL